MKNRLCTQFAVGLVISALAAPAAPVWAENPFQKAVRVASPSVVKIVTSTRTLFTAGREIPYGSGVIVHRDGYIVTAASRFSATSRLSVVLPDGSKHAARRVKTDVKSRLVILKIKSTGLRSIEIHRDGPPRVGQWVIAIGNPFGLARARTDLLSASVGVVSAFRKLEARRFDYDGPLILTDITLNPGGQGGAMVNLGGRLLGICGRTVTSTRTNTQLSYAVPASEVVKLLDEVLEAERRGGTPAPTPKPPADGRRGYLGAYILDDAVGTKGAYIDKVVPDSPADKAGLAVGDLVTAVGGKRVSNGRELIKQLDRLTVGARVELTVTREKAKLKIIVTLGKTPRPVLK